MVLWLQGLIFVSEKANYQGTRRLPICFFFSLVSFRVESKQAGNKRSVCEGERISIYSHISSCLSLPFFYPLLVVCSGISGLLERQSHCLYQSLGFPLPLLSQSTVKCCTLTVYLIFCRGLAGKGHSCISLDHMAATE